MAGGDIFTSSVTWCTTYKEEAGSTFDGRWGMRWWQVVDGEVENKEWVVGVGEDGKVGVYGDVTVDRKGSEMLDGGWNFSWDSCRVSVEEDAEVGKVISLVGLADGIWSEVVLTDEEESRWKGGDAFNVSDFGGAVRIMWNNFRFWVEGCYCGWQWLRWRWLGKCLNWKVWPGLGRWRWQSDQWWLWHVWWWWL